jgi:hypothetical protein
MISRLLRAFEITIPRPFSQPQIIRYFSNVGFNRNQRMLLAKAKIIWGHVNPDINVGLINHEILIPNPRNCITAILALAIL